MTRIILYSEPMRPRSACALLPVALAAVAGGLAGCSGATPAERGGRLDVVASFYPLQYVAQRVAGAAATVTALTKPGAEPHDLELTARQVARASKADLIVYLGGFQPSVDAAAAQVPDRAFDVRRAARLDLTYTPIEEGERASGRTGPDDPHFWLDPLRLAGVADALAARLGSAQPLRATTFTANAAALRLDLARLDREFRRGLARCANSDLVTSHNSFGYLAQRYGLRQVGITGLTPEQEPSPQVLADVTALVRARHVRTIYYEPLVSPAIAQAVAGEAGARVRVLDPIEALTGDSAGRDYLAVMRSNLVSLREGQPCR